MLLSVGKSTVLARYRLHVHVCPQKSTCAKSSNELFIINLQKKIDK